MADDLRGKVVVVTGAASGIGRCLARAFAVAGCRVALLDLDEAGAEAEALAIRRTGGEAVSRSCNVCEPAACQEAVDAVTARWGGIDVLINNAGISHRSLFADTDIEVIRRVMEVNFFGAVNCTQAALDTIVRRQGVIVALSSVAGFAPLFGRTGYAASKHALHGFFGSLRSELSDQGVGVLLICPSFVDTAIDRHALGGDGAPLAGKTKKLVGKALSPEEVAEATVKAVRRRQRRLLLSAVGKSSYWLWTLLPRTYERLMRRTQSAEFGD